MSIELNVLHNLIQTIETPLLIIDRSGIILVGNGVAEHTLGMSVNNQPLRDIAGVRIDESFYEVLRQSNNHLPHNSLWHFEHTDQRMRVTLHPLDNPEWLMCTLAPLPVGQFDTTTYQQMFESEQAVKYVIDPETGKIVDVNPSAETFYGYDRNDMRQMTIDHININSPEDIRQFIDDVQNALQHSFEAKHRLADGTIHDVLEQTAPIIDNGQTLLYSTIVDITEYKDIQAKLQAESLFFKHLIENIQQSMVAVDAEGVVVYANQAFCDLIGYSMSDVIGMQSANFVIPEDIRILEEQDRFRLQGISSQYEIRLRHRSGDINTVIVNASPNATEQGEFLGTFATFTDITARKLMEDELVQNNADLDAYSHTVAHDLKNPLAVLMGFADLLEHEFTTMDPEDVVQYLQTVGRTADKMINIIDELLLLAQMRHATIDFKPIQIELIVRDAIARIRYMAVQQNALIIFDEQANFPEIITYGPWIEAALTNYISNAIKYGGNPPEVEIGVTEIKKGWIRLWVRDNGAGIPEDKIGRLFDEFDRLEEARKEGQGIGLSIVKRIMDKLGGDVHVSSEMGQGSIFSLLIPPTQN